MPDRKIVSWERRAAPDLPRKTGSPIVIWQHWTAACVLSGAEYKDRCPDLALKKRASTPHDVAPAIANCLRYKDLAGFDRPRSDRQKPSFGGHWRDIEPDHR